LVAGGLALATTNLTAQGTDELLPPQPGSPGLHSKEADLPDPPAGASDLKASHIIGLAVCNETGVRLGKVQDLIISMASHSAPFAIVEYGGTLGIGATRVAVPLTDLKWSSESKELILTATREEFESASPGPTRGWMAVADEDWVKTVDRFYGQPSTTTQSRYERQEATGTAEGRETVRNPAEPKGATGLLDQQPGANLGATNMAATPEDEYILEKVNGVIRKNMGAEATGIQATIKGGIVSLHGKVTSEAQKQELENQIKAVAGVNGVEDDLRLNQ
jgi:osmotically-inducible protein OsmY/sporulation protein YlmC with PRC-barrel domain